MTFSDALKHYIDQLQTSPKTLAEASGIPPSTLSRYLSGDRTPPANSDACKQIAVAIAHISKGTLSEAEIARALQKELHGAEIDAKTFTQNFATLLDELDIKGNSLARALGFDPSYISRIRAGQRHPENFATFSNQVARYIARNCTDSRQLTKVMELCACSAESIATPEDYEEAIRNYLGSSKSNNTQASTTKAPLASFLKTLDEFDLNTFKESIHFDDIKIPTVPFQLPTSKTYTGIEEMKQAELDFLKSAVLARSTDDVIMYSDMPLEEMAADKEFPKKIMTGIAALIRKGVKVINIHNVHRPVEELIMGLEGWVPVYMTGLMESFYLPFPTNNAFLHFLRSGGSVACAGEAIVGNQGAGRYVVTKNTADVAYYRTRATQLLTHAKPLIKVFTEENQAEKNRVLRKIHTVFGSDTTSVGEGDFSTLSITTLPGRYVLISKSNPPAVDLLVEHPALVAAFEQYEPTLF